MNAQVKRAVRRALKHGPQTPLKKKGGQAPPPIRLLHRGAVVAPLIEQLEASPYLWDENVFRTEGQGYQNPHQRISDIIVRFNDWRHWRGDRAAFNEEHESVWWGPYAKLPYLQPLVFDLMRMHYGERLGMVLLTRIPPHCNVERHVDAGWHATHYLKFGVQIKAAPGQAFCFEGYRLETQAGDVFAFDNSKPHWVENPTDSERITLIVCMRLQQPLCHTYRYPGQEAPCPQDG